MLEPIRKLNLAYEFYSIQNDFDPVFDFTKVMSDEVFVYTNYFGVCDHIVKKVYLQSKNLIIDNSQAFYSTPLFNVDTFYSPRKFFGVPDGAYLYTDTLLDDNFETDISYQRFVHLLGRADIGAEDFYVEFKRNDDLLKNQPIKRMSEITQKLLSGIDYKTIAEIRRENFNLIHSKLSDRNELNLNRVNTAVPMVYPFLVSEGEQLKKTLIHNKVFVATYWPNVIDLVAENCVEAELYTNLLAIPIDQRYGIEELLKIVSLIKRYA